MNHNLFSVYDAKAEAFIPMFQLPTVAMAVRSFTDAANDPEHMFSKHPLDYVLYHLGEFQDETGYIFRHNEKILLGTAFDFKIPTPF